jgi:methyl-accepting chemotaxis protein
MSILKRTRIEFIVGCTLCAIAAILFLVGYVLGDGTRGDSTAYKATMFGLLVFVFIAALAMAVLIPRQIRNQVGSALDELTDATAQVRSIASQVASGAVQTATAISEAATTVDEVRQTSLLASQKSTALSDRAEEAESVAESGREAVSEIIEGMQNIHGQMGVVAETVVRLSEQSQAAEEIIGTSNQVAEQSNLLSVNAALEAAKAKEHGKGFGVVAEEMRNLAAQSKKAVQQIRTILADIQKATGEAVMAAEQSGKVIESSVSRAQGSSEAIESLADSVEMSAQSSKQIAASSQQQLVGMDQISESMESINSASAQNAQAAQQMAAEVERLQGVSGRLEALIVSGSSHDDGRPRGRMARLNPVSRRHRAPKASDDGATDDAPGARPAAGPRTRIRRDAEGAEPAAGGSDGDTGDDSQA